MLYLYQQATIYDTNIAKLYVSFVFIDMFMQISPIP